MTIKEFKYHLTGEIERHKNHILNIIFYYTHFVYLKRIIQLCTWPFCLLSFILMEELSRK